MQCLRYLWFKEQVNLIHKWFISLSFCITFRPFFFFLFFSRFINVFFSAARLFVTQDILLTLHFRNYSFGLVVDTLWHECKVCVCLQDFYSEYNYFYRAMILMTNFFSNILFTNFLFSNLFSFFPVFFFLSFLLRLKSMLGDSLSHTWCCWSIMFRAV